MALTKAKLIAQLIDQFSMNKHDSTKLVDQFFEEIRATLEKGEAVKLAGFGNFELRDKNSRPGRNPKTGEDIPITARRVVTFKASPKLKDSVEGLQVVTELS